MKNSRQIARWSTRNKFQRLLRHSFGPRRLHWGIGGTLALAGAMWLGSAAWQRAAAQQVQFNINTVVGSSTTSGLVADLKNARGVAALPNGTVFYIADTGNHVVRRVDTTTNSVTIVAGQFGLAALTPTDANGDGGLATSARLNNPSDVAVDVSGDLYISDSGDHKIRKVTFAGNPTGNISTIGGSGIVGLDTTAGGASFSEPRGLAYSNANNGTLYVADAGNHRVVAIPSLVSLTPASPISVIAGNGSPGTDGDGGPALQALLNGPQGVAVDGNRLFIADTGNHKVRVVTTTGGNSTIDTFAGTGIGGFDQDGIAANTAQLNKPTDVAVDGANVYISDNGNHRIRKVDSNSGLISTVAGRNGNGFNGDGTPATNFMLNLPAGMVFISNSVVFLDTGNRRLRRVAGTTLSTIVSDGSGGFAGDTGLATQARLDGPSSIAVDAQGNWYIADTNNHVIRKVTASDGKINTIAGLPGMASANPTAPNGDNGQANLATFKFPTGVTVDATGNIFVADTGNMRIRRIDRASNLISTVMGVVDNTVFGASILVEPIGVALDSQNNLYASDASQHIVVCQNSIGSLVFIAGKANTPGASGDSGSAGNARLNRPTGITVAGSVLYIADTNNHRVRKVERVNDIFQIVGIVPKSAGAVQIVPRAGFEGDGGNADFARLSSPTGVAVDSTGALYISDRGNDRIRRVAPGIDPVSNLPANIINTVIGNGEVGFSGDGGAAVAAALGLPLNLAVTPANEVLIADTGNNRIRLAVQPPNVKPALSSPGNKSVNEGQALSFNLQASDPNAGQTLTYAMNFTPLNPAPNPAPALNPATGAFSWTPGFDVASSNNPAAQFQFTFTVTDNGSPALTSDPVTITVTVNQVNGAPVVNSGSIPATLEASGPNGAQLQLNGTATDPDGDALNIVWTDTRPNQQPVTIATQLSQTVTLALGQHSLILTASDGKPGGTAMTPAKALTVQDTTAPVFSNLPSDINDTITSGNSKVVTFALPSATDAVAGVRPVTATPPSGATFPVGMTTVTFSASDTAGNTRTATIKVTITCVGAGCTGGGDPNAMNFNLSAFAGNGNFGVSGDSGAATAATLKEPRGVALDAAGNVYIADQEAHNIRRVNAQGNISLFAGTGVKGFAGDNGAALNARFNSPTGLAVDVTRNLLFVADTGNQRLRRIDLANNTITTLAGTGAAGLGSDGAATGTQLNYPGAVAVDGAGVVYVADTGNNRVVKISNNTLTAVAGTGQAGNSGDNGAPLQAKLNHPTGVAVTSDGTMIFVADRGNNRVRKITASAIANFAGNGNAATSGDNGQAAAAGLNAPTDVAVDGTGNVYLTETDGERIRKVSASDGVISTIAGNGTAGNSGDDGPGVSATLNTPTALVRNSSTGVIFFCDTANLRVRRLLPAGSSNNPPAPAAVGNVQLSKSQTLNLALSATDADGDPVTFTLVPALAFVTITNANPAARTATLFINPAGGNVGVQTVRVQAADNKGGTGLTPEFTITVTDPNNQPPVAVIKNLPAMVTASNGVNAQVVLDGSDSTDPNGDPLTYQWFDGATQIATAVMPTVTLAVGQHSLKLVVTDDKNASNESAPQTVTVSLAAAELGISNVTPDSGRRGQILTVIVNGQGFAPGCFVRIFKGGLPSQVGISVTTTFISSMQLSAKVVISEQAQTGARIVSVTNPGGAMAQANAFTVLQ